MKKDFYIEKILTAISHPNRIKILKLLRREKVMCGCEILSTIKIEQSNLSRHLNTLVQAGILIAWKEGVKMNYKVANEKVFKILDIAEQLSEEHIAQIVSQ
ncbi:MAG: metalloregulator ArsR/SmtB family transcription factor [Melioribacter sp.]|nr:metalloregulator ArsR/SmtB family transcription factor [Melioribacter sp.]